MQKQWRKWLRGMLCRMGWHNLYVEYVSAPGVFTINGKDCDISGTVERCEECWRTFFTYKDWPRIECYRDFPARAGHARQVFSMA